MKCSLSIGCLLLLFACATSAIADVEQTELRLKAAGVDPGLRARIHAAIGHGVDFLLAHQGPDGCWRAPTGEPSPGLTALCGLALRHAGTARGRGGARRAISWLFPAARGGKARSSAVYGDVYIAGITNLLLHADRSHGERARTIGRALALAIDPKKGWWHYATPFDTLGRNAYYRHSRFLNLSTSQFAVLGLWAERRFDAPARTSTWSRHLESLLERQLPDGSWPYDLLGGIARSYQTGTYMGLANLVLSEQALADTKHLRVRKARERIVEAKRRAMHALRRHARHTLHGLSPHRVPGFPYYDLFALEKVCVFLDTETLGDVAWYVDGARRLLDRQSHDGSWNGRNWCAARPNVSESGDPIQTAFALLFLLRVSETYHPITPSPVDTPTSTVSEAAPRPIEAAPGPTAISLELARSVLARLCEQRRDARTSNEDVLRSLDILERAWLHMELPAALSHEVAAGVAERWRREAEDVLLDLLSWRKGGKRDAGNVRHDVAVRAARILGRAGPRVSDRMVRTLNDVYVRRKGPRVRPEFWEVAFGSLAKLGDVAALRWLFDEAIDDDRSTDGAARTEAALRAAATFQDVPGHLRRELAEKLVRIYEGTELLSLRWEQGNRSAVDASRPRARPDASLYWWWQTIRYDAVLAFVAFTADPRTGVFPVDAQGNVVQSITAARRWWNEHEARTDPVWR